MTQTINKIYQQRNMKKIILLLMLTVSIAGYSQTASSLGAKTYIDSVPQSVSLANPWLETGVKLSYVINNTADFKDNLLFNVRLRKNLYESSSFNLPFVSNIGLSDWSKILDNTAELTDAGISAGIYPYFILHKGDVTVVPHFEVSAKVIPGATLETSKKRYKVGGNIELQIAKNNKISTVSTGLFYANNQNFMQNNVYGLDFTSLLALDINSALLIDYKKIFNGSGLLSLGIVIKNL